MGGLHVSHGFPGVFVSPHRTGVFFLLDQHKIIIPQCTLLVKT